MGKSKSQSNTAPSSPKSTFEDSGRSGVKGLIQRARSLSRSRSKAQLREAQQLVLNNNSLPGSPIGSPIKGSTEVFADSAIDDEDEEDEGAPGSHSRAYSTSSQRAKSPPPMIALPSLPPFSFSDISSSTPPQESIADQAKPTAAADLRYSLALLDDRLASLQAIGQSHAQPALPQTQEETYEEDEEEDEDEEDDDESDIGETSWTMGKALRVQSRRLSAFQLPPTETELPAGLFGPSEGSDSLWDALGLDGPKIPAEPSRSSLPYASSTGRASTTPSAISALGPSESHLSIASAQGGRVSNESTGTVRAELPTHASVESINSIASGSSSSSDEFNIKDFPSFEDYTALGDLPPSVPITKEEEPVVAEEVMSFPFPPAAADETELPTPKVGPIAEETKASEPANEALFEALAGLSSDDHAGLGLGLFDPSTSTKEAAQIARSVAEDEESDEDDNLNRSHDADLSSGSSLATSTAPSSTNANNSVGSEMSVTLAELKKEQAEQAAHLPDQFRAAALPLPPSPTVPNSPFEQSTFLAAFPATASAKPAADDATRLSVYGPRTSSRMSVAPPRSSSRSSSLGSPLLSARSSAADLRAQPNGERLNELVAAEWPVPVRPAPAPPALAASSPKVTEAVVPVESVASAPATPKMKRSLSQRFSFSLRRRKSEVSLASISAPIEVLPPLPQFANAPASAPLPSSEWTRGLRKTKSNPKLSAQLASRTPNARLPPSPALPSEFARDETAAPGPFAAARARTQSVSEGPADANRKKRFSLFLPQRFGLDKSEAAPPLPLPSPSLSVTNFGTNETDAPPRLSPTTTSSGQNQTPTSPDFAQASDLAQFQLPLPSPTLSSRSRSPSWSKIDQRLSLAAFLKDSPTDILKRPARTSSIFPPAPNSATSTRPTTPNSRSPTPLGLGLHEEQQSVMAGGENFVIEPIKAYSPQTLSPTPAAASVLTASPEVESHELSFASTEADEEDQSESSEDDQPLGVLPGALSAQKSIRISRHREKRDEAKRTAAARLPKSTSNPFDLELESKQHEHSLLPHTDEAVRRRSGAEGMSRSPSIPLEPFVANSALTMDGDSSVEMQSPVQKIKALPLLESNAVNAPLKEKKMRVKPNLAVNVNSHAKSVEAPLKSPGRAPSLVKPAGSGRPSVARAATLPTPAPSVPAPVLSRQATLAVPGTRPPRQPVSERRVFINDHLTHMTVQITPTTLVGEIMAGARAQGLLEGGSDEQGGYALTEICRSLGVERPLREFELINDVIKSWDSETNILIIRRTPLAPVLAMDARSGATATRSGWVQIETKRGKWQKKWLELNYATLTAAKTDKGKEAIVLVPLASYDAFTVAPHTLASLKAPKPFVLALKSRLPRAHFEKESEFCTFISCNSEQELNEWLTDLTAARNDLVRERGKQVLSAPSSPELGAAPAAPLLTNVAPATVPATASSLARSGTAKKVISRPPPPVLAQADLVAAQGSSRPALSVLETMKPEPRQWNAMSELDKHLWLKQAEKAARANGQTFLSLA